MGTICDAKIRPVDPRIMERVVHTGIGSPISTYFFRKDAGLRLKVRSGRGIQIVSCLALPTARIPFMEVSETDEQGTVSVIFGGAYSFLQLNRALRPVFT